jgi:hypothetical protein
MSLKRLQTTVTCLLTMGLITVGVTRADEPAGKPAALPADVQKAVDRGLKYLAECQGEDGAFFGGEGTYARNVAVVGLGGLAMLYSGSKPGEGPYGKHIRRCVDYVAGRAGDTGLISDPASTSHGPMYDHAFATLFLAKCYAVADAEVRKKLLPVLKKAVKLLADTQNDVGGWRYQPENTPDADITVTISQLMALLAARDAAIEVPKECLDKAVGFVKRCQNADGGFMYMLHGGNSAFSRSSAGVTALYAGGHKGPEIEKGLMYVMRFLPHGEHGPSHYFYGHYYAVQAMRHAGGERWTKWYKAVSAELTNPGSAHQQREDGSWADAVGSEYGTAMALVILQTPRWMKPAEAAKEK